MKAFIETFGCQMNEYDTERILYFLEELNYTRTSKPDNSDLIIINTCAVREKANNKLLGHLGSFKKLKDRRPEMILCVGGCAAQSLGEQIQKTFPFVDIVFGTHNISKLPELIQEKRKNKNNICSLLNDAFDYDLKKSKRTSNFQALVPISIGCNNYCSYCIVPYVRGKEKSIKKDLIINNIKDLVSDGVIEITLLGQNVNSYGKDFTESRNFSELLEDISDIKGLERIRFMTSHPKDFSEDLIEVIKERDNIVNHIHLPLQAGSNKILQLMNRQYSREQFINIVKNIRKNIPTSSITTDIIVGFPGEEYSDFKDTLNLIEKIRFSRAFTFIYSKREGTLASRMGDNVLLKEKKAWFNELLKLQNRISLEENEGFIGKMVEVLVEGISEKNNNLLEGRMENNNIVIFKGKSEDIGKITSIKINSVKTFYLIGEQTL